MRKPRTLAGEETKCDEDSGLTTLIIGRELGFTAFSSRDGRLTGYMLSPLVRRSLLPRGQTPFSNKTADIDRSVGDCRSFVVAQASSTAISSSSQFPTPATMGL
jgi:hypothetical protein